MNKLAQLMIDLDFIFTFYIDDLQVELIHSHVLTMKKKGTP